MRVHGSCRHHSLCMVGGLYKYECGVAYNYSVREFFMQLQPQPLPKEKTPLVQRRTLVR